jgi:hypothetical protein
MNNTIQVWYIREIGKTTGKKVKAKRSGQVE